MAHEAAATASQKPRSLPSDSSAPPCVCVCVQLFFDRGRQRLEADASETAWSLGPGPVSQPSVKRRRGAKFKTGDDDDPRELEGRRPYESRGQCYLESDPNAALEQCLFRENACMSQTSQHCTCSKRSDPQCWQGRPSERGPHQSSRAPEKAALPTRGTMMQRRPRSEPELAPSVRAGSSRVTVDRLREQSVRSEKSGSLGSDASWASWADTVSAPRRHGPVTDPGHQPGRTSIDRHPTPTGVYTYRLSAFIHLPTPSLHSHHDGLFFPPQGRCKFSNQVARLDGGRTRADVNTAFDLRFIACKRIGDDQYDTATTPDTTGAGPMWHCARNQPRSALTTIGLPSLFWSCAPVLTPVVLFPARLGPSFPTRLLAASPPRPSPAVTSSRRLTSVSSRHTRLPPRCVNAASPRRNHS